MYKEKQKISLKNFSAYYKNSLYNQYKSLSWPVNLNFFLFFCWYSEVISILQFYPKAIQITILIKKFTICGQNIANLNNVELFQF